MADRRFWSYEQLHETVRRAVEDQEAWEEWRPTLIVCIAAGGFVPTRILRSCLKHKYGTNIPIQTIGLALYDVEGCDPSTSPVQRVQWLSYGSGPGQVLLQGHRILIVDEVDDSRKTLAHAVAELAADITAEQQQHEAAAARDTPWSPPELGVFVLHNKRRPKLAELPDSIINGRYWAGLEIDNCWCVYPWDAVHIYEHTNTAEAAGLPGGVVGGRAKRQSSGCPAVQLPPLPQKQQQPAANGSTANGAAANGVAANGVAANGVAHVNGSAAAANGTAPAAAANGVHGLLNGV